MKCTLVAQSVEKSHAKCLMAAAATGFRKWPPPRDVRCALLPWLHKLAAPQLPIKPVISVQCSPGAIFGVAPISSISPTCVFQGIDCHIQACIPRVTPGPDLAAVFGLAVSSRSPTCVSESMDCTQSGLHPGGEHHDAWPGDRTALRGPTCVSESLDCRIQACIPGDSSMTCGPDFAAVFALAVITSGVQACVSKSLDSRIQACIPGDSIMTRGPDLAAVFGLAVITSGGPACVSESTDCHTQASVPCEGPWLPAYRVS